MQLPHCQHCGTDRPKRSAQFCSTCGQGFPPLRAATATGQARQEAAAERVRVLQALAPPSDAKLSLERQLEEFLLQAGASGGLAQTQPYDIRDFLIFKDIHGKTVVHNEECPHLGSDFKACGCPKRLAAGYTHVIINSLRAVFNAQGRVADWDTARLTGNPCASQVVRDYEAAVQKEQLAAGVKPVQAALIDESVYHALMQSAWADWAHATNTADPLAAVDTARDLLFYALLWHSGLRARDALALLVQNVELYTLAGDAGMYVHVGKSKTAKKVTDTHRIVIKGPPGDADSPRSALAALKASLDELGLTLLPGKLFRRVYSTADGSARFGATPTWDYMEARFRARTKALAIPTTVTLHSFHGSRAAREAASGVPAQDTCTDMSWSLGMYDHYTAGRTPLTMAAAASSAIESLRGTSRTPLGRNK